MGVILLILLSDIKRSALRNTGGLTLHQSLHEPEDVRTQCQFIDQGEFAFKAGYDIKRP